jgi:hypothetical protein
MEKQTVLQMLKSMKCPVSDLFQDDIVMEHVSIYLPSIGKMQEGWIDGKALMLNSGKIGLTVQWGECGINGPSCRCNRPIDLASLLKYNPDLRMIPRDDLPEEVIELIQKSLE